jgi:putative transposase
LSVPLRTARAMSQGRFRRTLGGVSSLGLLLVWWPKYRCRILGGRVAARCGELSEQVAEECGWQIVAKDVMAEKLWWSASYFVVSVGCVWESRVRGCIEYRWDAVLVS